MVSFAGWSMPLHYGSQIAEHHTVRRDAAVFDVSHMTIIDLSGDDALPLLRGTVANDPETVQPRPGRRGKAVYGVMLNESGGVIDDLIVYGLRDAYRVVANAATREVVVDWLGRHAEGRDVQLEVRDDLAMLAIQGPNALEACRPSLGMDLRNVPPFEFLEGDGRVLARTGYTGEKGLEVTLPARQAPAAWAQLLEAGIEPAGLAARDTLRLEAGLNLYGQDMDATVTPLESNLAWTVAWTPKDRDFIGRKALERQRAAKPERVLRGLLLEGKGVMRHGCRVVTDHGDGVVTSGAFSPTLGRSIALARLPRLAGGNSQVEIRGRLHDARIVRPPFVRQGQPVVRDVPVRDAG